MFRRDFEQLLNTMTNCFKQPKYVTIFAQFVAQSIKNKRIKPYTLYALYVRRVHAVSAP